MMRNGLRQAFGQRPGYTVVGEAATGSTALTQTRDLSPDLILMDIHLPDGNGLEFCRRLLHAHPGIKILVFTGDATRAKVDEALEMGICGYLSKKSSPEELFVAIDDVMAGRLHLSSEVSGDILKDYRKSLRHETKAIKPPLSDQEKLLLRLMSEGWRNKEIAVELKIGEKSVEAYRSRLMKKLDCPSSAELVRYAVREGIAEP